jgi:hypothetical protein
MKDPIINDEEMAELAKLSPDAPHRMSEADLRIEQVAETAALYLIRARTVIDINYGPAVEKANPLLAIELAKVMAMAEQTAVDNLINSL